MKKLKLVCFAISVILFAIICAVFITQNRNFFSPETEIGLDLYFIKRAVQKKTKVIQELEEEINSLKGLPTIE